MMAESPIETHVKPSRDWDEASPLIPVPNFIFTITTNVPQRRTLKSNFLEVCDRSMSHRPKSPLTTLSICFSLFQKLPVEHCEFRQLVLLCLSRVFSLPVLRLGLASTSLARNQIAFLRLEIWLQRGSAIGRDHQRQIRTGIGWLTLRKGNQITLLWLEIGH